MNTIKLNSFSGSKIRNTLAALALMLAGAVWAQPGGGGMGGIGMGGGPGGGGMGGGPGGGGMNRSGSNRDGQSSSAKTQGSLSELQEALTEKALNDKSSSATLLVRGVDLKEQAGADFSESAEKVEKARNMKFNFHGASLTTILDYIGKTSGYTIIKEVSVTGSVDMVSHKPLTPEEGIELLNSVLYSSGYAAIANGKTLTIVDVGIARTRDIPVNMGSDPDDVPRSDRIVTQIIPMRYSKAAELMENLTNLLPESAIMTVNENSNALLLTDTQTNIRRMMTIIKSLDQSISEITAVKVFALKYADATETVEIVTNIYQSDSSSNSEDNNRRQFFQRFGRGGGNEQSSSSSDSVALQAATEVTAIADERTNSVVINAPEELLPAITSLIESLDTPVSIMTEVRVFTLNYADAEEMVETITGIFASDEDSNSNQNQRFRGGPFGGNDQTSSSNESAREQELSTVLAVADTRTNSVIVSAVTSTMAQVAQIIDQLDKNPAMTQKVYVYSLSNANGESVAQMLSDMFGDGDDVVSETSSDNDNNSNSSSSSSILSD